MQRCVLIGLLVFAVGCGSDQVPTYPVRGRVLFEDGTPVRHGTIEFTSLDHATTASGTIDHDGKFVLGTYTLDDGAAAGEHEGIIVQIVVNDGSFTHTIDHGDPVPPKYAQYESSPLKASVKADQENALAVTIE